MPRGKLRILIFVLFILLAVSSAVAQSNGRASLWEPVDVSARDLYNGPGGAQMAPDVSRIKYIRKQTGGFRKKYRVEDATGRTWVAKLGVEARPETAAVRLLWALGYYTEINYLVPRVTIPKKGTFTNVRFEARPDNVERVGNWKWKSNPFLGTNEFQGLKIMQVLMTNWDVLDRQNQILDVRTSRGGRTYYIISDLGATFGKYGNNDLPIFFRLGRKTGSPRHYSKSSFIKGVKNGLIEFAVKGRNRGLYKDITIAQGRWLADLLLQLSDRQIMDAFRAANYSPQEADMFRAAVKRRISELDQATSDRIARRYRSR
jgi:hypothetical protein